MWFQAWFIPLSFCTCFCQLWEAFFIKIINALSSMFVVISNILLLPRIEKFAPSIEIILILLVCILLLISIPFWERQLNYMSIVWMWYVNINLCSSCHILFHIPSRVFRCLDRKVMFRTTKVFAARTQGNSNTLSLISFCPFLVTSVFFLSLTYP